MRLFISIDLPKKALDYASKIQEKLFAPDIFKGTLIKLANLHVTLVFLGEVDKEKVNLITKIIDLRKKKFSLEIMSLALDNLRNPKVIWFDLEQNNDIENYVQELKQNLGIELNQNLNLGEHKFKAHLTLARVRKIYDKRKFDVLISSIKIEPVKFIVDQITLKQTNFTNSVPEYSDLYINFLK